MTSPRVPRILIVDEEEPLTHVLSIAIDLEGWQTRVAPDGASALREISRFEPDIILIDVGLPDVPGTEVIAFLREREISTPAVFLTGRATHEDRAAAFASGGDHFITKPFGLEEVVDHLKPLIRRLGLAPTSRTVSDLVLDDEAWHAWRGNQFLPLTPLEYEMLHALVDQPGRSLSAGHLVRAAASRGVQVPRGFVERMLQRVMALVNGAGKALIHADDAGWMLAGR